MATPDITILADISAYFDVTIAELFALSDVTRLEQIENQWHISGEELDAVVRDFQRLEKELKK